MKTIESNVSSDVESGAGEMDLKCQKVESWNETKKVFKTKSLKMVTFENSQIHP